MFGSMEEIFGSVFLFQKLHHQNLILIEKLEYGNNQPKPCLYSSEIITAMI